MIATARISKSAVRRNGRIEPLENGERLTALEFMRRYVALPAVKKAELIEGVVYMGSPVRVGAHAEPDSLMQMWLATYAAHTPGVSVAANCTVQFDIDNVAQPDALLRILPECGGQSRVDGSDYLAAAPELVVEITASGSSIDLHEKLRVYRRHGVKEYLTWRTVDSEFDWRFLVEGEYRLLPADTKGIFRSTVYPGLWLAFKALLQRDPPAVLATLNAGLHSRAHRTFVTELATRRNA